MASGSRCAGGGRGGAASGGAFVRDRSVRSGLCSGVARRVHGTLFAVVARREHLCTRPPPVSCGAPRRLAAARRGDIACGSTTRGRSRSRVSAQAADTRGGPRGRATSSQARRRRSVDPARGPPHRRRRGARRRDVRKEADWDEIAAIMAHVRKVGRPPPDDEELPQHPTPRLNHAVRQLGRDGRVMEARELVTWMLRAGRANEHTFAMWFEALGRAGSASEALRGCLALFKAGSRRGGAAAGAGVPGAAPTGPLSVLYDGPPPGVPRVRVGSVAASAAMNAACLDTSVPLEDALDFLAAAKAAGMKLNARTYNAALHRCAIDGNAQEALSVLSVMQLEREIGNVELDTYTYAAVLRALDAGDMAAAVRPVYASMRVDTAAKLLRPDAPLMSHVLHLASLVGEVALAEDVVGDMDAWGIPWTLEVHNALLSVYGRQGNLPAALDWYRRRVVGAGTDPDVRTAVHLCVAAARASASMAAVLLLLDELASDLPRDTRATSPLAGAVLSCIRDAKDHAGPDRNDARGDEILRWYKHARRAGVRLHGPVYRLVVSALASAERVDDAERVFADMSAAGIVPTTTCITTLASAWEWTAHVAGDDAARARAAERAAELRELQGSLVQLHGADVMADDADAGPWEAESGGCSARRLLTGPP